MYLAILTFPFTEIKIIFTHYLINHLLYYEYYNNKSAVATKCRTDTDREKKLHPLHH
jgi:hypothetical protein